jgi:hypothetical protein
MVSQFSMVFTRVFVAFFSEMSTTKGQGDGSVNFFKLSRRATGKFLAQEQRKVITIKLQKLFSLSF